MVGSVLAFLAFASSKAVLSMETPVTGSPSKSTPLPLPRPRDGDVAVREELDAARRAGTLAAYDLFIARHPEHRLAAIARRERAGLAARRSE